MAITDVAQHAHLSKTDMEALDAELDTIRRDVEENAARKTPPISVAPSRSNAPWRPVRGC